VGDWLLLPLLDAPLLGVLLGVLLGAGPDAHELMTLMRACVPVHVACPSISMFEMGLPLPKAYWPPVNGSAVRPMFWVAPLYMSREVNWFRPGS
jgi:hypothetical protein